jgi:very-short-patch-repair endonuclease
VGAYIVDFLCAELSLVIELDGETHLGKEENDQVRQQWLEGEGFKVLRFLNPDVYDEREMVEEAIWQECEQLVSLSPRGRGVKGEGVKTLQNPAPSPPSPLPQGERGE